jgi:hypothetical protein
MRGYERFVTGGSARILVNPRVLPISLTNSLGRNDRFLGAATSRLAQPGVAGQFAQSAFQEGVDAAYDATTEIIPNLMSSNTSGNNGTGEVTTPWIDEHRQDGSTHRTLIRTPEQQAAEFRRWRVRQSRVSLSDGAIDIPEEHRAGYEEDRRQRQQRRD